LLPWRNQPPFRAFRGANGPRGFDLIDVLFVRVAYASLLAIAPSEVTGPDLHLIL